MKYWILGAITFSLWSAIAFKVGADIAENTAYLVKISEGVSK